jgi:hypothetical protein
MPQHPARMTPQQSTSAPRPKPELTKGSSRRILTAWAIATAFPVRGCVHANSSLPRRSVSRPRPARPSSR